MHEEIDKWLRKNRRCTNSFPSYPDLSKRDRSLITVAMLATLYRTDEMRGHMQRALDNGVTETELKGLIWPCAVNAGRVAIDVFGPK